MKSSYLLCSVLLLFVVGIQSQGVYRVVNSSTDNTHSYYTATLKYQGSQNYWTNQTNKIAQNLNFTYFFMSPSHLIVRITDLDNPSKWEVPHEYPFPHSDYSKKFAPYDNGLVKVTVTQSPFSFKITRKATNEVIFDSSVGELIFSDYYLQFSTSLATQNVFGFGERNYKLNLGPDGTYSILTHDSPLDIETGESGHSTYGYHPVYLLREKSNAFSMGLLRSSVGMDLVFEKGKKLTYKVMGGIIDLNFFLGGDAESAPETVVKQYHSYLGGWTLQPFWSFGFHQCRWGYQNVSQLEEVLGNYSQYKLPLDVMWSDIDYMRSYIDFTIDQDRFPAENMTAMLNHYKKRWVPIIDAGVAVNNSIHDIGLNNNVYIKDPNGTNLLGQVWPGPVNYPDWYNPNTSLFWEIGLDLLYQQVQFSGIWLDMNEASNFVPGEYNFVPDANDLLNNPPYKPTKPEDYIYTKAMRMDAVHFGNITEYYAHNTFGFLESKATYNYLRTLDDLVFILTRSSFYGSGRYTAHWTGDNDATYEFMALSIPTIINSGLYGMPMAGADICGFGSDTTEELCARWFQLGALYPFSRDHNTEGAKSQEPWAFGATLLETASINIHFKYAFLKHYYAQFLKQGGTGTIFRPLFFEYPADDNLYDTQGGITDSQFLIGEALMAAPALNQNQTTVNVYFPQDTWFDLITGELIQTYKQPAGFVKRDAPLNATAPVFLRGGHLIAIQSTENVTRSDDLNNDYKLGVGFKETSVSGTHTATGEMIGLKNFDDHTILTKCRLDSCLYTVNAKIVASSNNYAVNIAFSAQGSVTNYEEVTISYLYLFGDFSQSFEFIAEIHENGLLERNFEMELALIKVTSNVLVYKFSTPYKVQPGSVINVNIAKQQEQLLIEF
jgi:alpha-glucosidase